MSEMKAVQDMTREELTEKLKNSAEYQDQYIGMNHDGT